MVPEQNTWIALENCQDRKLYRLRSRNLTFGVFCARTGGFFGLREKFDDVFIFQEFHWDKGPPYGTVHPLEALSEDLPSEIPLKEHIGSICQTCQKACDYILWPEGGEREVPLKTGGTIKVPGCWTHLEKTDCSEVRPVLLANTVLFAWLRAVERKYEQA